MVWNLFRRSSAWNTWILLSNISPWGTMKFKDVSGSSVVGVLVFRTSGRLESGKIIFISGTILPDPSLFEQICNGLLKILSIGNILNNVWYRSQYPHHQLRMQDHLIILDGDFVKNIVIFIAMIFTMQISDGSDTQILSFGFSSFFANSSKGVAKLWKSIKYVKNSVKDKGKQFLNNLSFSDNFG